MKGIIEDVPNVTPYNKVYSYKEKNSEEPIIAFSIGQLTTLPSEQLKNDSFLSYEELANKFGDRFYPQGKRWPNRMKGNLCEELITLLKNSFKKIDNKNDFSALIKHFNQKCYFSGKIESANFHKTFKRRNGTDYFEYHHFIPQCKGNTSDLNKIIRNESNIICLCSNCHNKMHYGKISEVNEMIDILWKDEEIQKMLTANNFQASIGENIDPVDWIKAIYFS